MEVWVNTNKNALIEYAKNNIGKYEGHDGALVLAEDYGGDLATYDTYGNDLIEGSYDAVCKAVYGSNPPVTKAEWDFKVRDAFSWEWDHGDERDKRDGKKRLKLFVATQAAFSAFLSVMNQQSDDFTIENKNGTVRVSAKSALGAYYAYTEGVGSTFFLVNESRDGVFPSLTNFKPF